MFFSFDLKKYRNDESCAYIYNADYIEVPLKLLHTMADFN